MARPFPLGVHRQAVEHHTRVFKHTWQIKVALGDDNFGLASGLRQVKVNGRIFDSGPARLLGRRIAWRLHCAAAQYLAGQSRYFQPADAALGGVNQIAIGRHLPARVQRFNQAFGSERRDQRMGCRAQRQAVGNLSHRCQVKAIRFQFGFLFGLPGRAAAGHGQVAAWPLQTVRRVKAQVFSGEFKAVVQALAADTPCH